VNRLLATAVLVGLALLAGAGPAAAHNSLVSSDPADGASLATGPQRLTLVFDQPVHAGFNTITITGPDNTRWASGEPTTSGNTVSTELMPLGPAGEYVIGYRVVSADGHPVAGTLRFQLTRPGTGTPAPATTASGSPAGDGGLPAWPLVVAAIALVGVGVAVALRLSRVPRA
jgi:methionine-rich copper-binding protein CopC